MQRSQISSIRSKIITEIMITVTNRMCGMFKSRVTKRPM